MIIFTFLSFWYFKAGVFSNSGFILSSEKLMRLFPKHFRMRNVVFQIFLFGSCKAKT